MTGVFHHSYFIPWIGYFTKLEYVDIFVILDDVGFRRNHIKRVEILNSQGNKYWLTIPLGNNWGKPCNEIELPKETKYLKKITQTIEYSYGKANHYKNEIKAVKEIILNALTQNIYLIDANTQILNDFRKYLGLKEIIIVKSSDYGNFSDRTDRLVSISKKLNISEIIIGNGNMRNVHNIDEILAAKITLYEQSVYDKTPSYEQIHSKRYKTSFTNGLSIIDLLLNEGKQKTKKIIQNNIFLPTKYL